MSMEDHMSKWKTIGVSCSGFDAALEALTLGFATAPTVYYVEDEDTGERRTVTAFDREHLGRKIAAGDFDDD